MAMVGERLCLFVSVVLFPRISFRIESYLKEEMEGRADLGRGPSPTRQTGRQPRHLRRRSFVFLFFFFFLFFACVLYRRNRNRSRSIQTVERAMECIILRVFLFLWLCRLLLLLLLLRVLRLSEGPSERVFVSLFGPVDVVDESAGRPEARKISSQWKQK